MTPDELRAAAEKLTSTWDDDDRVVSAPDDREWWDALKVARDVTRRLADVIEYAERNHHREHHGREDYAGGFSDACEQVLAFAEDRPMESHAITFRIAYGEVRDDA